MPVQNPSDKRRLSVDVATAKTLAATDGGTVQNVTGADVTVTLYAVATTTIRSAGVKVNADGPVGTGTAKSQKITVTGTFAGLGKASGSNSVVLAKADQQVGDEISFVNGVVSNVVGKWTAV